MSNADAVVVDAEGLSFRARLEPAAAGEQVLLELEDGTQFLVPNELLVARQDGRFDLKLRLREYAAQTGLAAVPQAAQTDLVQEALPNDAAPDETVVRLAEESLRVGKRTVERGRVRLRKTVTERLETVDLPLVREQVEVERVSVGRPVEEVEGVRYEGDTLVIPRYEEVLVVTKQLVLVEELRVSRRRSERREPQEVVLRREELSAERADDEPET